MKLTFYNESMRLYFSPPGISQNLQRPVRSTMPPEMFFFQGSFPETETHLNLNSDRIVPRYEPEDQFTPVSDDFTTVATVLNVKGLRVVLEMPGQVARGSW